MKYVIMPDHWHALIKQQDKETIESIVGSIKQRVFHASRQDRADPKQDDASKQDGRAVFHGGAGKVIR